MSLFVKISRIFEKISGNLKILLFEYVIKCAGSDGCDVIFDVILVKVRLRMVHNKYNDWFAPIRPLVTLLSASICSFYRG